MGFGDTRLAAEVGCNGGFLLCSMYQLATSQLFVHVGAAEEATGQTESDNDKAESESENDGVSLVRMLPPFVVAVD